MKPLLLDTFCKAGGAGYGYHLAGFEVVGVDIEPQPRYPFEFHQADALEFIAAHGHEFDVIHASPPCQAYSVTAALSTGNHPDLIEPTRTALLATGKPYVIENVPGSPLVNPVMLCGTMFPGLRVIRHRLFETSPVIWWPPMSCNHNTGGIPKAGHGASIYGFCSVAGNGGKKNLWTNAMQIEWMTLSELSQAIPPAYTKWLGERLLEKLSLRRYAPRLK